MKHVERTKLYTDINYRFAYLSEFIDFTDEDKAVIVASAPMLADQIPAVVEAVYAKLLSFDVVAESFLHRMTNYSGEVIRDLSQLTTNSEQIKFRQAMLKKYLTCLMIGVNDGTTLLQYMDWVALIHTKNNSKHSSINVEYIHLNAMLSFLNSAMIDCIYALNLPRDRERKTLKAFSKLFFIQNDLMALYYTSDGLDIPDHMANRHHVVKTEAAKDPVVAKKKALELVASGTAAVCAGVLLGWMMAKK
ncbi:Protoglobin-domain-containing protein [Catenaria anguillulae PL171]|uniref:Protoglobin-domain-containing protein n=1 Tax=Catenaria anguillulae PL171 TaxID=765915 RepID=A0A1Y2HZX4_9FUNG|nr:Protoglobin-domain-containing protein [Catenaria anguillulae PL171]ORZ38712.1 Protoglobin-domain-containing protein [Catenaria anguillulae PL171]